MVLWSGTFASSKPSSWLWILDAIAGSICTDLPEDMSLPAKINATLTYKALMMYGRVVHVVLEADVEKGQEYIEPGTVVSGKTEDSDTALTQLLTLTVHHTSPGRLSGKYAVGNGPTFGDDTISDEGIFHLDKQEPNAILPPADCLEDITMSG